MKNLLAFITYRQLFENKNKQISIPLVHFAVQTIPVPPICMLLLLPLNYSNCLTTTHLKILQYQKMFRNLYVNQTYINMAHNGLILWSNLNYGKMLPFHLLTYTNTTLLLDGIPQAMILHFLNDLHYLNLFYQPISLTWLIVYGS